MVTDQLDRIDRNIVAALARDGRLSMAELASTVGLSKTPVQARVKRLEKDGIIRGYAAVIDREKMGEGHVAFVQVTLSDTRSAALDAFNRAVLSVGEIEQFLGIQQAVVSQQLARLRGEQVVRTRREGRQIYYRIADPQLAELISVLYKMYCGPKAAKTSEAEALAEA